MRARQNLGAPAAHFKTVSQKLIPNYSDRQGMRSWQHFRMAMVLALGMLAVGSWADEGPEKLSVAGMHTRAKALFEGHPELIELVSQGVRQKDPKLRAAAWEIAKKRLTPWEGYHLLAYILSRKGPPLAGEVYQDALRSAPHFISPRNRTSFFDLIDEYRAHPVVSPHIHHFDENLSVESAWHQLRWEVSGKKTEGGSLPHPKQELGLYERNSLEHALQNSKPHIRQAALRVLEKVSPLQLRKVFLQIRFAGPETKRQLIRILRGKPLPWLPEFVAASSRSEPEATLELLEKLSTTPGTPHHLIQDCLAAYAKELAYLSPSALSLIRKYRAPAADSLWDQLERALRDPGNSEERLRLMVETTQTLLELEPDGAVTLARDAKRDPSIRAAALLRSNNLRQGELQALSKDISGRLAKRSHLPLTEDDEKVRFVAGLLDSKDKASWKQIEAILTQESSKLVRITAIRALSGQTGPEADRLLSLALETAPDWESALTALEILGQRSAPEIRALFRPSDKASSALHHILDGQPASKVDPLLKVLEAIGPPQASSFVLLTAWENSDPEVKARGLLAIRNDPTPKLLPIINGALKHPDSRVQSAAVEILRHRTDTDSLKILLRAIEEAKGSALQDDLLDALFSRRDPASIAARKKYAGPSIETYRGTTEGALIPIAPTECKKPGFLSRLKQSLTGKK